VGKRHTAALLASLQILGSAWAQAPNPAGLGPLPIIDVRGDDTRVTHSARLRFSEQPIADLNGNGVVQVEGSGLRIECQGRLRGPAAAPEARQGVGLRVSGSDISVLGFEASGFKIGLWASRADRLQVIKPRIQDGFAQRLHSTPLGEDPADWLWPHDNDQGEWRAAYGAGLLIEDSADIEVRGAVVRGSQNGILLERINGGHLEGNDASFLSGWGLALWRSNQLLVRANRFDFCVRGYAHGYFNRGQDSAGILLFEQCSHNVFIKNSACYSGDGIFGFAGKEALEQPVPEGASAQRGCNHNVFENNLLSHNVAHGLELTFSFGNVIRDNQIEDNGICGMWLGYARQTRIEDNLLRNNGGAGYGAERGGINAEHAQELLIRNNVFENNRLGLRLWSDADEELAKSAWVQAQGQGARRIAVGPNRFVGPEPWVELRATAEIALAGDWSERSLDADAESRAGLLAPALALDPPAAWRIPEAGVDAGQAMEAKLRDSASNPHSSALLSLGPIELPPGAPRDRAAIVIGAYGPYDWESLYLEPEPAPAGCLGFRVLGPGPLPRWNLEADPALQLASEPNHNPASLLRGRAQLCAREPGCWPFVLKVGAAGQELRRSGKLLSLSWQVRAFALLSDPRETSAEFEAQAAQSTALTRADLKLPFGTGGPAGIAGAPPQWAQLPNDHFGILAETHPELPPGRYRLRTLSDDGLRVWLDGAELLADWTWHGARHLEAEFELSTARPVALKVAYFELEGAAALEVELLPL
jgi:parallel beta-helix repeat protein